MPLLSGTVSLFAWYLIIFCLSDVIHEKLPEIPAKFIENYLNSPHNKQILSLSEIK